MILELQNNTFHYEMQKLTLAFFPDRKMQIAENRPLTEEEQADPEKISVVLSSNGKEVTVLYSNTETGAAVENTECGGPDTDMELAAGRALYRSLSNVTGISPKWGILTGVRPSKVMTGWIHRTDTETAKKHFVDELYVAPEKAELAASVSETEEAIIRTSTDDSFSLYISIPFCPTRCSYCSFVSHSIATPGAKKLVPQYYEKLLEEIRADGEIAKNLGLKLRSVYIGGGTPSTLSSAQTAGLLAEVHRNFNFKNCTEFTFEAGRPDTITYDKLKAAYDGGADRISINPQTMTDSILKVIGRNHSVEQIYTAFEDARKVGFENINMDLIAGLPGDTPENFEKSLDSVIALAPESVTVHTLAYKRSSSLVPTAELFARGKDTSKMIDESGKMLSLSGYKPYYMYRQTRSVGNLENVGWCIPGKESYYNIYMMEECHSIFACGASAVTKLLVPGQTKIKRIANFKYPYEYVDQFARVMSQKEKFYV